MMVPIDLTLQKQTETWGNIQDTVVVMCRQYVSMEVWTRNQMVMINQLRYPVWAAVMLDRT